MNIIKIAQAASDSIVSCSGSDCTVCSVLETVSKVYNFILGLSFAVAVLFLTFAGLVFIFGTGRKAFFEKAKVYARNVIAGFIFVLVGWIAIHAVLYSTGYKNAGSWWQFSCKTESVAETQQLDTKNISSYSNIADFIASGRDRGIIKEPISSTILANSLKNLNEGERLTFYLPARKNKGNQDVLVPFLAGYKTSSGFQIDNLDLLTAAINSALKGDLSFLNADGSVFTKAETNSLINTIVSALSNTLLGSSTSSAINLFGSSVDYDEVMKKIAQEAAKYTSDGSKAGDLVADVTGSVLDKYSSVIVAKDNKNSQSSADRSDTTKEDKWKNTQSTQSKQATTTPRPGSSSDDWSDLIDQNKDKKKPEGDTSLCDDDWDNGDGTRMAVLKALRRLYKRDRLRYEMMFRFVDEVGDHPQGGECTDCGKIKVTRKAKILDISHMLVHEGTHSGQFCLGLMDKYIAEGVGTQENPGPGRGKIEAIACANAMGSIETSKSHKNMDEFTKGSDGKPIENLPRVTLGASTGQGGTGQIRGNLARYWTEVSPKGDLDTSMLSSLFQFMTDYPIKNKYENYGDYHYGFCSGSPKYLMLRDPEEKVVEAIVTSKEKCKSSPPKDILPPCKSGDKAEPLPQVEACKSAPEMQIE